MLDLAVPNHEIKLNGYEIVRKDRNRHCGGVAIYIRNSINYIIRDDLFDENLETITIEISKPKSKPFLINCWYRPCLVPSRFQRGERKTRENYLLGARRITGR
jgi:hypothetical protein